jgi:hypothetical protein
MPLVGSLLALTLLAACGQGVKADESATRTIEAATVTDVPGGTGPVLCEDGASESASPQCEGPVITNWDWSKVWGVSGDEGARFGEFCVIGKDVGEQFELTALPRPVGTCGHPEYVAQVTVLEDGGTFGSVHGPQLCLGPIRTSLPVQCGGPDIVNWDWGLVDGWTRRSKTTDGFYTVHGIYVDGDFTLTRPPAPVEPGEQPRVSPTEDRVGAGPRHTDEELRRIQRDAQDTAGRLMLTSSSAHDHVDLDVILDEGDRLQIKFDEDYGKGVVRVTSALRPAPPGM